MVPEFLHLYLESQYEHLRYESSGGGSTRAAITCDFLHHSFVAVFTAAKESRVRLTAKETNMADTVNKGQLVDKLIESTNLGKKDVKAVFDGVFDHISEHLKRGDKVQISGFGSFEVRERKARQGVNPSMGTR